jgi:L-asparaginase II
MPASPYLPLFELTRGRIVESIHFGAIAVVDACGCLIAHYGNVQAVIPGVLRQLGVLDSSTLDRLVAYRPVQAMSNWRKLEIGQARPRFELSR